MDIEKILVEEIEAADEDEKNSFGQRNGAEFPEIARSVLGIEKIQSALSGSALVNILRVGKH